MTVARHDDNWIRCGECGAKLFLIKEVYRRGEPNAMIEIKCKSKSNGKTCNCMNDVLI